MSVGTRPSRRMVRPFRRFVGVVVRPQTYRNLVYLALTFPLGLAYFFIFAMGLPLGLGLSFALVGVPVLVGLFLVSDRLLVVERWLAATLLGTDVPLDRETESDDVWDYLRNPLSDLGTWAGLVYLASKFVVGLLTFVFLVVAGAMGGAYVLAPLYYESVPIRIVIPEPIHLTFEYVVHQWGGVEVISLPVTIASWQVTTLPEALAVSVVGVIILLTSLHLCNVLARIQGWYTRLLITPRPIREVA